MSPLGESPMGRQVYLNRPHGVIKVVISLSFSANGIWWYPDTKSIVEYTVDLGSRFLTHLFRGGKGGGGTFEKLIHVSEIYDAA